MMLWSLWKTACMLYIMMTQKDILNMTKKQMKQISAYYCELCTRFLLCKDAIFHRIPTPLDIEMQGTTPRYVKNQLVLDGQRNDLWINRQPLEMEIGPRHKLT